LIQCSKWTVGAVTCCFVGGLAVGTINNASAATSTMRACVTASGKIVVRSRCVQKETELTKKQLTSTAVSGLAGPQGEKGLQGERGHTGERGTSGPRGSVGERGQDGLRGPVGEQGIHGLVGPQGTVGPKGSNGDAGPQGLQGVPGPQGIQGAQGAQGLSGFSEIPQGLTIRGVIGGDFHSSTTNTVWGISSPLYGVAPANLSNELVVVQNNGYVENKCDRASCLSTEEINFASRCSGSVESPTAPPGWLCVYPSRAANASNIRAVPIPGGEGRYGFFVQWTAKTAGGTAFRATWAYTAP